MRKEYEGDPQNPTVRRAYIVRPSEALLARLASMFDAEDVKHFGRHVIVTTEPVIWEGKLEGFRATILREIKQAHLEEYFEDYPFSDTARRTEILGSELANPETFDRWWIAEETDIIEIETNW